MIAHRSANGRVNTNAAQNRAAVKSMSGNKRHQRHRQEAASRFAGSRRANLHDPEDKRNLGHKIDPLDGY